MNHHLCDALLSKIDEQIERTVHLISVLPPGQLGWTPPIAGAWAADAILGHLLDCLAGFCAVLYAAHPDRLPHFRELRALPVNQACDPEAAAQRISRYRACIQEGFALLPDE